MHAKDTKRPAVLIVEDEPLLRMDAVDMIQDAGFKTYDAPSADVAIEIIGSHDDIGILFTDIDMPGSMDGLKLAKYVRAGWPSVKILIASGVIGVGDEEMPEGSKFYAKPYATSLIIDDLRTLIAQDETNSRL